MYLNILLDYRLEKACQFLKNPQLRIGEVSEKVGINDVRYLAVCLRKNIILRRQNTETNNKR